MQQLSIFDWMTSYPDINDISESQAVQMVGDAIGVKFEWSEFFDTWLAKVGKTRLDLKYGHFVLADNHDLYIGVGYWKEDKKEGGGFPLESIEKAIKYFKAHI